MTYQWYPGHMTKTVRELQTQIKLIDLVIEIVDARIPASGRNPDLERFAAGRARMILFGKMDLADPDLSAKWLDIYKKQGLYPVAADLRKKSEIKGLVPEIRKACHEKIERNRRRGIQNRPIRAMVVGIPNVGKSTFINTISGSASLKTGNKPGVTRGRQWIRLGKDVELLDTPGLLWPKFEDQLIGRNIAFVGSMPDEVVGIEELSLDLLKFLMEFYPGAINRRYGVEETSELTSEEKANELIAEGNNLSLAVEANESSTEGENLSSAVEEASAKAEKSNDKISEDSFYINILTKIGRSRGCLKKGGAIDTEKAARVLLEDFRSGRLGRITLDRI